MNAEVFWRRARTELATRNSDDGWARGALALCEMYADVDRDRFEAILVSLATGRTGLAIADGARWLLPRWKAST